MFIQSPFCLVSAHIDSPETRLQPSTTSAKPLEPKCLNWAGVRIPSHSF